MGETGSGCGDAAIVEGEEYMRLFGPLEAWQSIRDAYSLGQNDFAQHYHL